MPYYLVDVTELPYPHTMESRNYDKDGQEVRSNWPSRPKERNVSSAVARDDCRELFTDTTSPSVARPAMSTQETGPWCCPQ